MRNVKEALLEMIKEKAYRSGEFKLSSGNTSQHYVNCKPVILNGRGLYLTATMLLQYVDTPVVAGLTLGADPLVAGVAMEGNLDGLIIRKEPKGHGTEAWIEGKLPPEGTEITILEDVITTGGSSIKAAQKVIDAGYKVKRIVSIVDRQEGGSEAIKEAGFESISIFKLEEIV